MPTNKKSPAARGKRRGKHRAKRLKSLDVKSHWLANDAPYGEYRVDTVALELLSRGATLSTHREDEFVRLLREPLINLRIMAHCAFDSRATVWTGS
jgi:hypothetical protein